MSANVDGMRVAPAIPSAARARISISGLVEYAAGTDAPTNAAPPTISRRRRPTRSPRVPILMRKPAMRNP